MVEAHGKSSSSKWSNVVIKPGDRVRLLTPGGGGWGDPARRRADLLEEDLAEGWVTAPSAE
jgi:N-methylhydantoinase B/oxoprolinase/acetone carboxylase alpha subunit